MFARLRWYNWTSFIPGTRYPSLSFSVGMSSALRLAVRFDCLVVVTAFNSEKILRSERLRTDRAIRCEHFSKLNMYDMTISSLVLKLCQDDCTLSPPA